MKKIIYYRIYHSNFMFRIRDKFWTIRSRIIRATACKTGLRLYDNSENPYTDVDLLNHIAVCNRRWCRKQAQLRLHLYIALAHKARSK